MARKKGIVRLALGLDALDEDGIFSSGKADTWRQKPQNMEEVHVTIDDQVEGHNNFFSPPMTLGTNKLECFSLASHSSLE